MEKDLVIVVDERDKKLGISEKIRAHLKEGVLHRAFLVFIFDNQGKILIQKRSRKKMLWPLFWDCSLASHPKPKESYKEAGERRIKEELGFSCPLRIIGKFRYKAKYKNIGAEKEICAILFGKYSGPIKPNRKEVSDLRWIKIAELKKDISENPERYTPWLKIGFKKLLKKK